MFYWSFIGEELGGIPMPEDNSGLVWQITWLSGLRDNYEEDYNKFHVRFCTKNTTPYISIFKLVNFLNYHMLV